MASNTKKDYTQMHIKASEHPKAYSPYILILNIVMSILGAIIGLELIVRTGVAPNTSIVGALFAIIISRLPIAFLKKYQSIHCQNMIQTSSFPKSRRSVPNGSTPAKSGVSRSCRARVQSTSR